MASSSPAPHTFNSKLSPVEIPNVTLTEFVLGGVPESCLDSAALVDAASGREVTFRNVRESVRRFGAGITAAGLRKGEVVAIYSPNSLEYPTVFHGVVSVGGVISTINPQYTAEELNHQLVNAGARFLVTTLPFAGKAVEAAKGTSVEAVYVVGDETPDGCLPYSALVDNDGSGFPDGVQIDPKADVAVLPYSSGTTGLPKGVMLTHHNLVANIAQLLHPDIIGGAEGVGPADTLVALLPMFHIYAMVVILNLAMRRGCRVVVLARFQPQEFLDALAKYSVTVAHIVPPIALFLAKHPLVDQFDLSSLREVFSGAAPLGAELSQAVIDRLKLKVLRQGYGMTELSPATHVSPREGFRLGTAGILLPNLEMRVVDVDSGEAVGAGKEGEVWVRGPNVMKGYLNNDEATRITIREDGFLRTGDIGVVDADGHLTIVDRLKELIKVKGNQVAPAELEAVLLGNQRIADAAVIGVPDERAGEVPKAFVVRRDPELTEDEVKAHVASHLTKYKHLASVEFVDAIPKSASGKILRRKLRDSERAKLAAAAPKSE